MNENIIQSKHSSKAWHITKRFIKKFLPYLLFAVCIAVISFLVYVFIF